jgi:multisubunit Na+/H+ antiporter MnhC subunit
MKKGNFSKIKIISIVMLISVLGLIISGTVLLFDQNINDILVGQIILGVGVALLALFLVVLFVVYKSEQRKSIKQVNNAQFESTYVQELNQKSGTLVYNEYGKIIYISD